MKKLRITLFACASLLLVSILLIKGFGGKTAHAGPASHAVHATSATCGSWSIIPSANVSSGQTSSILSGIAHELRNEVVGERSLIVWERITPNQAARL